MKKIDLILFWLKVIAALLVFDIVFRTLGFLIVSIGH